MSTTQNQYPMPSLFAWQCLTRIFTLIMASILLLGSASAQEADSGVGEMDPDRMVAFPWYRPHKEVPVFYSVKVDATTTLKNRSAISTQRVKFRVHQGKAETLSVALIGEGKVAAVTAGQQVDAFSGEVDVFNEFAYKGWAIRTEPDGKRFLDIHVEGKARNRSFDFEVVVTTNSEWKDKDDKDTDLLLIGPADATGYSMDLKLVHDGAVDVKLLSIQGLMELETEDVLVSKTRRFVGSDSPTLKIEVIPSGLRVNGLEMESSRLYAALEKDGKSVNYRLEGMLRSEKAESRLQLLAGNVAIMEQTSGDGWRIGLRKLENGDWVHELIAARAGDFPIRLSFAVPVTTSGDWKQVNFTMLSGVVVPVRLSGFDKEAEFSPQHPLVPRLRRGQLIGYLPPTGKAAMAWQKVEEVKDGSLFFSSTESTDVRVGSGLMRQRSTVDLRVLQGKLTKLFFDFAGKGEILSVHGDSTVVGWKVTENGGKRQLEVSLSRPVEKSKQIIIEAQVGMEGKPLKAQAIRLSPVGALRHSGFLRVANQGSVRVEVMDTSGLIQLAPDQFPGGLDKSLRQAVVYRFPSAEFDYTVNAAQVLPEISVNEVTIYELGESDRRIYSDLELDIREAPIREWELSIPADHAVSSVSGAQVVDYAVGSEVEKGMRTLTVLFKGPIMNRQLVRVVMARNEAPKAGPWKIQPLGFAEVKSRRGYIGAVAAPGYRLEAGKSVGLAEIPVSFFPKRSNGLQQAFRLREKNWSLDLMVEALGQSVQADVFHLYSLKSGATYGSVLINYFVVGAPATEWKIEVPEGIGNIDVTGQNVGRDWRRTGNTVVVPLSRPVLGAGTVLLTFEEPMSTQGGTIVPGAVRPLEVQGERGIIQVVSPQQVNHNSTRKGSLLEIDPSEIPTEFQLLSNAPTLKAWQYTARDFEIGMEVEWFQPGETISQVVDFQKLNTHISRDGQWVTDSQIFVKSKGRSVLRMKLPEGSKLWEARVNGEAVNARSDMGDILVPLVSEIDPNQSLEISIRYGAKAAKASRPLVAAPQFEVPVVIGEWLVEGDEGQRLSPKGGNANLVAPVERQSGWEWLGSNTLIMIILMVLVIASWVLFQGRAGGVVAGIGLVIALFATLFTLAASMHAMQTTNPGSEILEYAAPVVGANQAITVELANQSEFASSFGFTVVLGLLIGIGLAMRGCMGSDRLWLASGLAVVLASLLAIHGGAFLALLIVAASLGVWWVVQLTREISAWSKRRRDSIAAKAKSAASAAAASMLAILAWMLPTAADAEAPKDTIMAAESVQHDWDIRDGRLYGSVEFTLSGEAGNRYLLLEHPAVLNEFKGNGLKVVNGVHNKQRAYWLVATEEGRLTGVAEFEMPVNPANGWRMPTGPAAMQKVKVQWDESGWEFSSPAAVKVEPVPGAAKAMSAAMMSLSPMKQVVIRAQARQRDVSTEATRFYCEVSNLFLPGPGVVNGRHQVKIRPAQGQVRQLSLRVPDGYTVSDVLNGPIGNWRFDPDSRLLRVIVQPAQSRPFSLVVETQRSAGDLPVELGVAPLRVNGAAGEVGLIGMAFGAEVQPEGLKTEGLSKVNPSDFNSTLIPTNAQNQPVALLLHAFRYGAAEAALRLRVNPVAPELRSNIWQLVSLGEDRLTVVADIDVMITRAGVFRLQLEVPNSLEVESATGEGLSHWTQMESKDAENGTRMVTLHLSGKTIGQRSFNLQMVGRPVSDRKDWVVPKVQLQKASRETGVLTVVPERGLRVRAIKRQNITQLDPRQLVGQKNAVSRAAVRPDALSYRLLQSDWQLGLSIRRLDPWVTARVFHDSTIREGQVLTRLNINYRIDNAAVKARRVKITGLDKKAAATLRATGAAVADFVPVEGEGDLWEIRFRRGIAGQADVTIEYQRPSVDDGSESITPIELVDVRQTNTIVALRAGGRLELEAESLPRGWQFTDWAAVQNQIGSSSGIETPHLTFKVADSEGPLKVIMKRHDLANLRKIRVSEGSLTSLLSPGGNVLTTATMRLEVVAKSTMRLKLPQGAELFNVFVNGEGAPLVREDDEWLFYVFPRPEGQSSELRFTYTDSMKGPKQLHGPVLDVPMENLTWRVLVPEGWRVADYEGDFDLKRSEEGSWLEMDSYQEIISSKSKVLKSSAVQLLDKGNRWAAEGDQKKAIMAYSNVLNSGNLDDASNEDARVQLRKLKTQQAVLGLNSRRQRLIIDNRAADTQQEPNAQIDQAAAVNPVLQGKYNFDPNQLERFLDGNSADENAAIKAIANRVVAQQLAAEPAPAALDITLPERGTVMSFGRSVQVGSDEAMTLDIKLERASGSFSLLAILFCLTISAVVFLKPKSSSSRS